MNINFLINYSCRHLIFMYIYNKNDLHADSLERAVTLFLYLQIYCVVFNERYIKVLEKSSCFHSEPPSFKHLLPKHGTDDASILVCKRSRHQLVIPWVNPDSESQIAQKMISIEGSHASLYLSKPGHFLDSVFHYACDSLVCC